MKRLIKKILRDYLPIISIVRFIDSISRKRGDLIKIKRHQVNLIYWHEEKPNLGDELSPVIYNWMLNRKCLGQSKDYKTRCLLAVGSVLGTFLYHSTVWGTGVHYFPSMDNCFRWRIIRNLDIRALRGPITQDFMRRCGYLAENQTVPLGDPAILMPLIYQSNAGKKYEISLIQHYKDNKIEAKDINHINIQTSDYKAFIDQVVASKRVISSSLHGIILAEAYGVPAVFYLSNDYIQYQMPKYLDWYWSTGRYSVKVARTIEEALAMEPMELPDLKKMQQDLLDSFPYDIFEG